MPESLQPLPDRLAFWHVLKLLAQANKKPAGGRHEEAEEGDASAHNQWPEPRFCVGESRDAQTGEHNQEAHYGGDDSKSTSHCLFGSCNGFREQFLEDAPLGVASV
jgi:hypothetical protein